MTTNAPSLDDLFGVISAATFGRAEARVPLPDDPELDDVATRLAVALNVLLDDWTARARAVERMAQRLLILTDAARDFSATTRDPDGLLGVVARRTAEVVGDLCMVRLVSEDGLSLVSAAIHARDEDAERRARAAFSEPSRLRAHPISLRVHETGEPFVAAKLDLEALRANTTPADFEYAKATGIHSVLIVALRVQGRSLGQLVLHRYRPGPPFDEHDQNLACALADHAALAIANSRSYAAERDARAAAVSANRALLESEHAHRLLFEASPLPLFVFDVETLRPIAVNEAALDLYGYAHDDFLALRVTELTVAGHEKAEARMRAWGNAEATGRSRYRRRDGSEFLAEFTTRALSVAGRRARIAAIEDITERHEAEQARAILAAIVESSNDAIVSKRLDGTITSWNAAAERLFGYTAGEAVGSSIVRLIPLDRLDEERSLIARIAKSERVEHYETVRLRKDGSTVEVAISLSPIFDAAGSVVGASKTARDLTAQRKAEEALRHTEEQLRQSQKMEAVGRLAGGVAHDFNNVLSVIISYGDMLLADLTPGEPMRDDVEEITKAGRRAADLTRQLLMFSRQQVLEPKVLELNDVLAGMDKMLQRILGADVDLVAVLTRPLGRVRADRSSIEQVIMNLVVNARDAMPTGGKLTLETGEVVLDAAYAQDHLGVTPGSHVMLAVTDTGTGIDKATLTRIFEPFFTTKAPGKGTGLGLSTVFGIVHQSGGSVWVYSEPGKGTTFKVYLPRVEDAVDVIRPSVPVTSLRGSETILLVEDDDQVRVLARGILGKSGYHVIEARNAGEALLHCEKHPGAIHLLLSDVVMPQMSGPELAKRLSSSRPDMRVLCMSGYTDDSIVRHGVLDAQFAFLQKPLTPETLTTKVREVLDTPAAWPY